ncbi:Hypothetical predicted protein [Paramuricea clavata]|uniref:Uncharacterized protein n=1 Tax=Paramuricea clavata TaxID=317549 RepID=A0A6S7GVN4_PARCT|nr:Hypothetical predicted protein [Paramuricea clavata]
MKIVRGLSRADLTPKSQLHVSGLDLRIPWTTNYYTNVQMELLQVCTLYTTTELKTEYLDLDVVTPRIIAHVIVFGLAMSMTSIELLTTPYPVAIFSPGYTVFTTMEERIDDGNSSLVDTVDEEKLPMFF